MLEDEGPVDPDQLGKLTEDDDDDQLDNEDPTGPDQFIADVAPIDETTTEDQEIEEFEPKQGTLYTNNAMHNQFIYTAPDEVDDPVVVDGDILLSKEQAAIYKESGWDGLVKSAVWSKRTRRWGRIIPYYIHSDIRRKGKNSFYTSLKNVYILTKCSSWSLQEYNKFN